MIDHNWSILITKLGWPRLVRPRRTPKGHRHAGRPGGRACLTICINIRHLSPVSLLRLWPAWW